MPGGAQTITPGPGSIQLQPAFMSVVSVTPTESAVSPEDTAPADGITLGLDGDAGKTAPRRRCWCRTDRCVTRP